MNVTGTPAAGATVTTPVMLTNSVMVGSDQGAGNTSSASITLIEPAPPQIYKYFGAPSIALGGETTLNFTISNLNDSTNTGLTDIAFTDNLPLGLTVATPSNLNQPYPCGGTTTANPGSNSVSLTGGALAAGTFCEISLDVIGTQAQLVPWVNNVTASAYESGSAVSTSSASITVVGPLPPAITSVTPNIGAQGQQNLQVNITGMNFVLEFTGVTIGGGTAGITVPSVTVNSTTSITALVNIDPSTPPGNYDVVVTVYGVPPPATLVGGFTVAAATIPPIPEQITVNDQVTVTPLLTNFAPPAAFFSPSTLGFASGGTQTLTVSNVGGTPLTFSSAGPVISAVSGTFKIAQILCYDGSTTFPTTLPSGGACTLTINYTASGTPTNDGGTIVFTDNAALSSPASTGTGPNYTQTITLSTGQTVAGQPPSGTVTIPTITENITVNDVVKVQAPAPTITSITPNSGPAAGGETVVIAGQNFQAGATVLFGSTPATSVTVNSATSISAVVPTLTPGSVSVTVENPDGQSAILASAFTVTTSKVGPTVTFTGAPASAAKGFSFTVTATTDASVLPGIEGSGACLAGPVSGTPASATATITMTAAVGTCTISAVWAADNNFTAATLTQSTKSIAVNSISPARGEQGQTLTVTLTGVGFVNGVTTANFGPNITAGPVTVTDSDDANVTITIPPAAPVGPVQVFVTTGTYVVAFNFSVMNVAYSLSPPSGKQGQTLTVAIAGKGFVNGVTTASFGPNITAGPVTVMDADDAIVTITIAPGAPIGRVGVTVTTGAAGSGFNFFVTGVTFSLSPPSGKQGQTLDVAIAGKGFVNGVTTASFGPNITAGPVTVMDADDAIVTITIAPGAPIGRVGVTVTTGAAGSGFNFFVTGVTYSLSPPSGKQGQTLTVAITGKGFVNGVTTASFGPNITAGPVTVTDGDDATVTITIAPNAPVGRRNVTVTTGAASSSFNFFVTGVTFSLSPPSGKQGQTLDVAIAGEGFVNGVTTANFGANITVNYVTVTDADDATANITIAPRAPIGRVMVMVTTGTAGSGFNFFVTGVAYSLSPPSGAQGQTLNVAITGEGFANGVTTANFGANITVHSVTVSDSEDAIANITIGPSAPIGRVQVSVITGTAVILFNGRNSFTVLP